MNRIQSAIFFTAITLFGVGIGMIVSAFAGPAIAPSSISALPVPPELVSEDLPVLMDETTTTTALEQHLSVAEPSRVKRSSSTTVVKRQPTTTTEAPRTPLEIAQAEVGKTGPYAEGGYWCAKALSWFAIEAGVEGFIPRDGPSALYADAKEDGRLTDQPIVGGMIFIDLFGPEGNGYGQPTHVGIAESVDGDKINIIQGNGKPDPSVVTRTTYELGDGYVIGFAPFEKAA